MLRKTVLNLLVAVVGFIMIPTLVSADVLPSGCALGADGLPDPSCNSSVSPNLNSGTVQDIRNIVNDNVNGSCLKYAEITIKDVDFTHNSDEQINGGEDFTFQFCESRDIRFASFAANYNGEITTVESGHIVWHPDNNECYVSERSILDRSDCKIKFNPNLFAGCSCPVYLGVVSTREEAQRMVTADLVFTDKGDIMNWPHKESVRGNDLLAGLAKSATQEPYTCPAKDFKYQYLEKGLARVEGQCTGLKKASVCCCKLTEQGSLSKKYECEAATGIENADCKFMLDKNSEYQSPREKPADGNCAAYNTTNTNGFTPSSSGFTINNTKLFEEAKKLNKLGNITFNDLIGRVVKGLMSFMGMILFVFYIYAGLLWMLASGNDEQITKAKNILVWATLGVAVMLGSYVIVKFIFSDALKLF